MVSTETRNAALTVIPALSALIVLLSPATPCAKSVLDDAYVFPGAYVSYNVREGYRKFDGVSRYVPVENTNPFIIGLQAGKRISVDNRRLRFQAAVEFGRGSVKDGDYADVELTDGTVGVSLYSIYWTGGLLADAHLLFPIDARTFFVSAGVGAHLTHFGTALKTLASGKDVSGWDNDWRRTLSPSVNLGCGIEYKLTGRGAACISYGMRFWKSASYKEAGALFPMGIDYTEFFYSMAVQLQYLISMAPR
jgi:hypothetical protein